MTLRDKIRRAAAVGDWRTALRLAASIAHDLGENGPIIARAHEATWNPRWCRQLGRQPEDAVQTGVTALRSVFKLDRGS